VVVKPADGEVDEKKAVSAEEESMTISLPGAADGTNAREVICAARKGNLLCTAFHPELTDDYRWHEYFVKMVKEAKS
jgi:glutamine amidotransferase PdxT